MKKRYETPVVEKVAFVSEEAVCGVLTEFKEMFGVSLMSAGDGRAVTNRSVFDWEGALK